MRILTLFIALSCFTPGICQQPSAKSTLLNPNQIAAIFTDTVCKKLHLAYPIFRVYQYEDKTGQYYCILTESREKITGNDAINYHISALNVKAANGSLTPVWAVNDGLLKNERAEISIWFWSKYIEFKDYDKDGIIEPLVIYGSSALNGTADGRIKFIIYFRGKTIAIRHQNGVLEFERETKVDRAFYSLPTSMQQSIKQKMQLMMKNNMAIFPAGWEAAMKNKQTFICETK